MGRFVNLVGQKFNRLTVVERFFRTSGRKIAYFNTICECGNTKIVSSSNLQGGQVKSCGCLRKDHHKKMTGKRLKSKYDGFPGLYGFVLLYGSYKAAAKIKGRSFELTEEEFRKLSKSICYYCDAPPSCTRFSTTGSTEFIKNSAYKYNGIDRKDNTKNYTLDNVVPCCKICNLAKRNMTENEWSFWLKRLSIAQYRKFKGRIDVSRKD